MTDKILRVIGKYALILSLFYLVEFTFSKILLEINADLETRNEVLIKATVPLLLTILLNALTSVLIHRDMRELNIKTSYVILATLIYRPIGVCAFILCLIYDANVREREQSG